MKTESRTVEIRLAEDESRLGAGVLEGVLLPFDTRAADRNEVFEKGSLEWPEDGILLREMHDRARPVARFVPTATDTEVRARITLPDTTAGRDAKANVLAGVYKSLSVEFRSIKETMRGELRVIQKAMLVGAGLVDQGAYSEAVVEARSKTRRRRLWL